MKNKSHLPQKYVRYASALKLGENMGKGLGRG